MFANPDASDNEVQEIEYLKSNDKIIGFRIQGVGRICEIEISNNKPRLKI